ncbi:unnamed protein product [Gongylonema pulchrum]|uniref:WH2 domain-containing protein n=1 Tax=Gongylonema pulchrum TaxID=637853 RepID=A0A183EP26_9BILA|nr:unnamed protein product [Gongylonema pulchrum]
METVPVPPAPPPPTGIPAAVDSSSFGDAKWKMRTEARNGCITKAEGSVEIPERQSVASLRKQIASKLEVKMPTTASSHSTATSGKTDRSSRSGPTLFEQTNPSTVSNYQYSMPSTSYPVPSFTLNQSPTGAALPKQQSIVHEPAQRHQSCITPVSFSRTTVLTSSAPFSCSLFSTRPPVKRSPSPTCCRTTACEHAKSNHSDGSVTLLTHAMQSNKDNKTKAWNYADFRQPLSSSTLAASASPYSDTLQDTSITLLKESAENGNESNHNSQSLTTLSDQSRPTSIISDHIHEATNCLKSGCDASSPPQAATFALGFHMPSTLKPLESRTVNNCLIVASQSQERQQPNNSQNNETFCGGNCESKEVSALTFGREPVPGNSLWYPTMHAKMQKPGQQSKLFSITSLCYFDKFQ